MPPEPSTAAYFWLWPLVFIGVPVLLGISMLCRYIFDRADPPHRAKLSVLFTIAFWGIFIPGTFALVWWSSYWPWSLVNIILWPVVIIVGARCFSTVSRQSRMLWSLGVVSLAAAMIFGMATTQATQHRDVVLGIIVCAISALFSGFCFGRLASRGRRIDDGVRPPIESNGAQA